MYAAKVLGKTEFGVYNHYVLVYSTISGFLTAGTQKSLITFINADREQNKPLFIRLLLTFAFFLFLTSLLIFYIGRYFYSLSTCLALIAVVPNVFVMLAGLVYRSGLNAKGEVAIQMTVSLSNSLLTILLLILWASQYAPILADFLSLLIPSLIVFYILSKSRENSSLFILPSDPKLSLFWKTTGPLWIAGILSHININARQLLVDWYLGVDNLAILSFVVAVFTMIQRPIEMIQRAVLPVLTINKEWEGEEKKLMSINLLIFPLLAICIFVCYTTFLELGNYHAYKNTLPHMLILGVGLPIGSIEFIFVAMCIAVGRQDIHKNVMFLSIFINLPLYYLFIVKWGLLGAFCSYSLYSIVYGLILGFKLRHIFKDQIIFACAKLTRCMIVYLFCLVWIYKYPDTFYTFGAILFFVLGTRGFGLWDRTKLKEVYRIMKKGGV
ncbi:hypothetical protein DENIS_0190 [Desulfonema ishimotonii]|uniref:Polysaccharide biosynthesis protein C-terminal domain-containing protein n=2 Tax=Desulfonema ishimotonii TaxID=45657 RepID=A0A401FQJ1_9BACT|nr:hypothetical protein DENIS_0190 [Desulfonema ishimotonii]